MSRTPDFFSVYVTFADRHTRVKLIRQVQMMHEPIIVVAKDRQISDLVHFCTPEDEFGIMTIDPTFSLGKFDVTVIMYRHLL